MKGKKSSQLMKVFDEFDSNMKYKHNEINMHDKIIDNYI